MTDWNDEWDAWLMNSQRFVCSRERPMPDGADGQWAHVDVADIGTCSAGCCDRFACRSCGIEWTDRGEEKD